MSFKSLIELMSHFNNKGACVKYLAQIRWPDRVVCHRCGGSEKISYIKSRHVWWCGICKKQFSVTVGTIFEESRIPLPKWFAAIWIETSHKKGISSCQLAKDIDVTQKTAWFMLQRIRNVMGGMNDGNPMFGVVEIDETYHGGKERNKHNKKKLKAGRGGGKSSIIGMKERGGRVKTISVNTVDGATVQVIVRRYIMQGSHLMTDEHRAYNVLNGEYSREVVTYSTGEYVKGQAHTNSIESVWALFKRGVYGIYHHVSVKHLHRYLAEFYCRHNTCKIELHERFALFIANSIGHGLTYQGTIK